MEEKWKDRKVRRDSLKKVKDEKEDFDSCRKKEPWMEK